jgi:hypothetical protein
VVPAAQPGRPRPVRDNCPRPRQPGRASHTAGHHPRRRPATTAEQAVLARWSGWGAVAEVFDAARQELAWAREELASLLTPGGTGCCGA